MDSLGSVCLMPSIATCYRRAAPLVIEYIQQPQVEYIQQALMTYAATQMTAAALPVTEYIEGVEYI